MENILGINQIQEGIEIKIENIPVLAKAAFVYAGIVSILVIGVILYFISAIPLLFKIVIPIILLLMFLILRATASQIKHMAIVLSKQGNNLYIKRVFSKKKIFEKTIKLSNPKLILVNMFLISLGYSQLLLKNGNKLELLIPVEWDVVGKFPLIHPRMKKFLYTAENARQLSKLLGIPLEESQMHFSQYIVEFKKSQ